MKTFISLLITAAGFAATAQVVPITPITPGAPNISPVAPGFENAFGQAINTQFGTNVVPNNFGVGLAALQNDIQQLLPLLAAFNDSVDFSAVVANSGTNGIGTATGSTAPVPATGVNLSTRSSSDFSTLLSQDVSARTAGAPPNGSFSTALGNGANQTAIVPSPTGVNNPLGLAPGFGGPVTTNAFGNGVTTRDALRDLIILQDDLERLLPVLVTLNASSLPPGFTNMVGTLNNATSSAINTALMRTGR